MADVVDNVFDEIDKVVTDIAGVVGSEAFTTAIGIIDGITFLKDIWETITSALDTVFKELIAALNQVVAELANPETIGAVTGVAANIATLLELISGMVSSEAAKTIDDIKGGVNTITGLVGNVKDTIGNITATIGTINGVLNPPAA